MSNNNEPQQDEQKTEESLKNICQQLLHPEMENITKNWVTQAKNLQKILKDAVTSEMEVAQQWWNTHSIDEKQSLLVLSMQILVEDCLETGEAMLISNIFPEIDILSNNHELVMKYITNIAKNSRYALPSSFNIGEIQELLEKETTTLDSLRCVNSLIAARQCLALRLCINILTIANELDD
ncbi:Uncharacterized protein QTN25_005429 [Entamoeba marina]